VHGIRSRALRGGEDLVDVKIGLPSRLSPEGEGLLNVRVGNFAARPEAEHISARLRDEEKFKPFIVKP